MARADSSRREAASTLSSGLRARDSGPSTGETGPPRVAMLTAELRAAVLLGSMHAMVDAASVATVFAEVGLARLPRESVCLLVLGYDTVAFGMQAAIGLECDRERGYRGALLAGLTLTLLGVLAGLSQPYLAMLLVGLGNALFHVGAGALVLTRARGRAGEPGVFIAPGAVGLAVGQALGAAGFPCRWVTGAALALCLALAALCVRPADRAASDETDGSSPAAALWPAAAFLLLAVLARATMAGLLSAPWTGTPHLAVVLVGAAVAGKALGGLFADRFGWKPATLASLVLLGLLGPHALALPEAAAAAAFLCQVSTGVTLAALFRAMPGRPGLAFGLASLALLLGAVPGFTHWFPALAPASCVRPLAAAAFAVTWLGLGPVSRR